MKNAGKDALLQKAASFPRSMFSFQDNSEISSAGKDGQISALFPSMRAPAHAPRIGRKEEMLSACFFLTNTSRAAIFPCTASTKIGSGGTPAAPDRRIRAASNAVPAGRKRRKHGPRPSLVSASLTSLINGQMGAGSVRPHTSHLRVISSLRPRSEKALQIGFHLRERLHALLSALV